MNLVDARSLSSNLLISIIKGRDKNNCLDAVSVSPSEIPGDTVGSLREGVCTVEKELCHPFFNRGAILIDVCYICVWDFISEEGSVERTKSSENTDK